METHWPAAKMRFPRRAKAEEAFPEANATEVWEAMQHLYFSAQEAATESRGAGSGDRDMSRVRGNVVHTVSTTAILRVGKMLGAGEPPALAAARDIVAAVASDASAVASARASARLVYRRGDTQNARVGDFRREHQRRRRVGLARVESFRELLGVAGATAFLKCAVFFTALFHVLASEADPATRLVELIPLNDRVKAVAVHSVTECVRGVFVSCLKLALFHAAFTWVTFRAVRRALRVHQHGLRARRRFCLCSRRGA